MEEQNTPQEVKVEEVKEQYYQIPKGWIDELVKIKEDVSNEDFLENNTKYIEKVNRLFGYISSMEIFIKSQ